VRHEAALEMTLLRIGGEGHEVEDVRVLQRLLGEVGLRRRERRLEVRERLAGSLMESRLDLRDQNVARPAVLDGLPGIPEPIVMLTDAIEEPNVVTPGQSCNKLLHNSRVWPRLGERPHVLQVARREPLHLRKRNVEVGAEPLDDVRPPPFRLLPAEDVAPDGPVEKDQLRVDRQRRLHLRRADAGLQFVEPRGVASREIGTVTNDART